MKRLIALFALLIASASAFPQSLHRIIFILRPDINGMWSIQDDGDHSSYGVDKRIGVVQGPDFLRVYFNPVFDKAGVVQVTTDDDFAGSINVGAGLGTQNVTFTLRAQPYTRSIDAPIDPMRIWDYVRYNGGGNLWVSITMVNNK
jgi:hypothetical protein